MGCLNRKEQARHCHSVVGTFGLLMMEESGYSLNAPRATVREEPHALHKV